MALAQDWCMFAATLDGDGGDDIGDGEDYGNGGDNGDGDGYNNDGD